MYDLHHFTELSKSMSRNWHDVSHNIYDFHRIPLTHGIFHHLDSMSAYMVTYYAAVYWGVLVLSVYGLFLTLFELMRVCVGHKAKHSFRVQRYNVFPADFRRHARMVGTLVTAMLLGSLIVGVLKMKPDLMVPWLVVQLVVVVSEIALWFCDCWADDTRFSLRTFTAFMFVYLYWLCVWCIRQTFLVAISQGIRCGLALMAD